MIDKLRHLKSRIEKAENLKTENPILFLQHEALYFSVCYNLTKKMQIILQEKTLMGEVEPKDEPEIDKCFNDLDVEKFIKILKLEDK